MGIFVLKFTPMNPDRTLPDTPRSFKYNLSLDLLQQIRGIKMPSEEEVVGVLKDVVDPHTGTDVYSMGLVSDLDVDDDSVSLVFTPTSPFCPMGIQLAVQIKKGLMELSSLDEEGIDIEVEGHVNSEEINKKLAGKGE